MISTRFYRCVTGNVNWGTSRNGYILTKSTVRSGRETETCIKLPSGISRCIDTNVIKFQIAIESYLNSIINNQRRAVRGLNCNLIHQRTNSDSAIKLHVLFNIYSNIAYFSQSSYLIPKLCECICSIVTINCFICKFGACCKNTVSFYSVFQFCLKKAVCVTEVINSNFNSGITVNRYALVCKVYSKECACFCIDFRACPSNNCLAVFNLETELCISQSFTGNDSIFNSSHFGAVPCQCDLATFNFSVVSLELEVKINTEVLTFSYFNCFAVYNRSRFYPCCKYAESRTCKYRYYNQSNPKKF